MGFFKMLNNNIFKSVIFSFLLTLTLFSNIPAQARFLSKDPVGFVESGYNPQMFNRYSYANNNPINMLDPTGEEAEYTVDEENMTISVSVPVKFTGDELTDSQKEGILSDIGTRNSGTISGGKYDGWTVTTNAYEGRSNRNRTNTLNVTVYDDDEAVPTSRAYVGQDRIDLNLNQYNNRAGHEVAHLLFNQGNSAHTYRRTQRGFGGRDNVMNFGSGWNSSQLTRFLRCRCNTRLDQ